jgi:hypothetical protein
MKLFIKVTLLSTAVALSLSSCKKKKEDPAPAEEPAPVVVVTPSINTIAEVFTVQGAPVETFTVNTAVAQTITIPNSNGLKVEIPANAFLVASGGATVGGIVDLSVRAIMDKEEVMLSGAGANSSGAKLISTRGCVKITASQNSQTLRLVPGGGGVVVAVPEGPTAPTTSMQKFYSPKVTATDSTKMWALGTDATTITTGFDSGIGKFTHRANLDSLKWLNVGAQWDSVAPKVSVTATVNATNFSKTNTVVYLSLNGSLTVGALFEVSPGVFRINNMVAGKGANIVAISVINGQYYWARTSVLVSATTISLDLQPVSISTIRTNIQALP